MRKIVLIFSLIAPFTLSACGSISDTFGFSKNPPDEFRVITKSPLFIPKDFSLRPPRTGESAQVSVSSTNIARSVLTGLSVEQLENMSAGERALLSKVGGDKQTGAVREELDNEANNTRVADPKLIERLTSGLN